MTKRSEYHDIVAMYRENGVVRIHRLFDTATVASIRAEIDRYIREDLATKPDDACTREADGKMIRNLWRLEQHNNYFRSLAQHPGILALVSELVGGEPVLEAVETFNKPSRVGSAVPLHQDNAYFCQVPPDMLTVWIAIDPVTVDNGAVSYILGSHQGGLLPTRPSGVAGNSIGVAEPPPQVSEPFFATLQPGDATIHHCEVLHQSTVNGSGRSRLGLLLVYRGVHTETDPQLKAAYDKAVAATPLA